MCLVVGNVQCKQFWKACMRKKQKETYKQRRTTSYRPWIIYITQKWCLFSQRLKVLSNPYSGLKMKRLISFAIACSSGQESSPAHQKSLLRCSSGNGSYHGKTRGSSQRSEEMPWKRASWRRFAPVRPKYDRGSVQFPKGAAWRKNRTKRQCNASLASARSELNRPGRYVADS